LNNILISVTEVHVYLLVFSAPVKYRVVKITRYSSEVVMQTMKHIVTYLGVGPSLEVIALHPGG
jgi:hypothetical protein